VTYAADFAMGETRAVVEYEADRAGVAATRVLEQDWCAKAPDWLISVAMPGAPLDLPARKTAGPAACPTIYQRDESFPAWGSRASPGRSTAATNKPGRSESRFYCRRSRPGL